MRYAPEHKAETHQKIVKDASRRVRAEGITGAAVSAVMRDAGLTAGGFYKHFENKDELLIESLDEAFQEIADRLAQIAETRPPETAWKTIVKTYLSPEHCDHPEFGCPLAALAPELARTDPAMKAKILEQMVKYENAHAPIYARPTHGRQRARIFRDFFDDARSGWNGPHHTRSDSPNKRTCKRTEVSPAQLLNARATGYRQNDQPLLLPSQTYGAAFSSKG